MIEKMRTERIVSIDYLRGIVMILMALDHVRSRFFNGVGSLNLEESNTALFMTRWITHFCAPVFFFLAGTGIFLAMMHKDKSYQNKMAFFLLTRGFLLILIDSLLLNRSLNVHNIGLGVLWALGISMIINAGLIYIPWKILLAISLISVLGHNMLDHLPVISSNFWKLFYTGGIIQYAGDYQLDVYYMLFPWIFVMSLGLCFGRLFRMKPEKRRKILIGISLAAVTIFIILRFINIYGDPVPWALQKNSWFTFLSFINCEKYPPSLLFLLMTLGPAIGLLAVFERFEFNEKDPALILGRVPLFFYILHLPLIYSLKIVWINVMQFFSWNIQPELFFVYPIWIGVVVTLLPICWWYYCVKSTHKYKLLKYL